MFHSISDIYALFLRLMHKCTEIWLLRTSCQKMYSKDKLSLKNMLDQILFWHKSLARVQSFWPLQYLFRLHVHFFLKISTVSVVRIFFCYISRFSFCSTRFFSLHLYFIYNIMYLSTIFSAKRKCIISL